MLERIIKYNEDDNQQMKEKRRIHVLVHDSIIELQAEYETNYAYIQFHYETYPNAYSMYVIRDYTTHIKEVVLYYNKKRKIFYHIDYLDEMVFVLQYYLIFHKKRHSMVLYVIWMVLLYCSLFLLFGFILFMLTQYL